MKRKLAFFAAAIALAGCATAIAALAPVCDPATVASGTVTNTVTVPHGMTGWAEVDIVAVALPTNVPAIYTLATMASIQFQSAAVNSNLLFITTTATNTTRAAVLRYTPTYPPR